MGCDYSPGFQARTGHHKKEALPLETPGGLTGEPKDRGPASREPWGVVIIDKFGMKEKWGKDLEFRNPVFSAISGLWALGE